MAGPIHFLQWHITHGCNLRCVHCYQEEYKSHTPLPELLEALEKYTAYVRQLGMPSQINLTGGEPLLHPGFFPLAERIVSSGHRLGVLTNGTLITDETARRLARLKPVFVQISLDGTEKLHDAIRGEGNYRKAMEGVDHLKKHGVKVLISFTAQQSNINSFSALARYCRRHHVDKLWWDRVVTDDPSLYLSTEQFRRLVKVSNRIRKRERFLYGKPMVSVGRALQALTPGPRDGCYRCGAGGNLLIFLANGDVMPCRRLPFIIGNVKDTPLEELVRCERMEELRNLPLPEKCGGCKRAPHCRGGARCVTYAQTGRLDVRDVNCFY